MALCQYEYAKNSAINWHDFNNNPPRVHEDFGKISIRICQGFDEILARFQYEAAKSSIRVWQDCRNNLARIP
eukprot:1275232-Prorocentrum_lima.AAC.1